MRTIVLSFTLLAASAMMALPGCSPGRDEVVPPEGGAAASASGGSAFPVVPYLPDASYIVVAILVGLILAVAFQLLLTSLSVAAGISMLGPLDEEDGGKSGGRKRRGNASVLPSAEEVGEEAREITGAFGLWAAITTAISLFAACWLAGELGLIRRQAALDDDVQGPVNALLGALIGLTTWGLFYTLLTTMEGMAITSAVGSLIRTAMAGFKSVASATTSLFEPSAKQQASDMAEGMTKAVADVLQRDGDAQRLKRDLRDYLRELKPRPLDPGAVRRQVAGLLDDLELHAVSAGGDGPVIDVEGVVADLRSRGALGPEAVESVRRGLSEAFDVARAEASDPDKGPAESAIDAAQRLSGKSRRSAEAGRRRLEQYLGRTDLPELDPEGIKRDLTRLFTEPRAGAAALRSRVAMMDRETVRSLLEARSDVSPEQADRILDAVQGVVSSITGLADTGRDELDTRLSRAEGGAEAVRRRAERKLRSYFDSLGQPELDYDGIKDDVALLFHDPQAGAEALKARWQAMDRDALRAVIASSRSDLDEDDAEALLSRLESVRDEALSQADKLKSKARRELKRVRREALEQAEEIRKVAADAAWWAFGTAAVSGAAAIVGGVLGATELSGDDGRVRRVEVAPLSPQAGPDGAGGGVGPGPSVPAPPPEGAGPAPAGAARIPVAERPEGVGRGDRPAGDDPAFDAVTQTVPPVGGEPATGGEVQVEDEPAPTGAAEPPAAGGEQGPSPGGGDRSNQPRPGEQPGSGDEPPGEPRIPVGDEPGEPQLD
ncbi:ICP22 family protein [Tautonia plasticadhaerens]|uniref:Uncharacterized protein n=1 Tax=Tautonia plasticadhaerens TaxID=2527974 RepID=A0A518HD57_9BACT|nr:proline-rich domain-containing protein [Tautonia plasticadhaerens]QDV38798.1 hypothetical protein ElP_67550 [Tautonia plasticadhaerens]